MPTWADAKTIYTAGQGLTDPTLQKLAKGEAYTEGAAASATA